MVARQRKNMEIGYSIHFHPAVAIEDIPKLDGSWKENIKKSIRTKLIINPELFGSPLRQSLKGLRKLRVGDYRVIYQIKEKKVLIIMIGHRSVVYKVISKRI